MEYTRHGCSVVAQNGACEDMKCNILSPSANQSCNARAGRNVVWIEMMEFSMWHGFFPFFPKTMYAVDKQTMLEFVSRFFSRSERQGVAAPG